MENFMNAFFTIDKDRKQYITVDDLKTWMTENNFDSELITRWLDTFTHDANGVITLENFCTRLGLKKKKALEMQDKHFEKLMLAGEQSYLPDKDEDDNANGKYDEDDDKYHELPPNVEILFSDMSKKEEIRAANIAVEEAKNSGGGVNLSDEAMDRIRARMARKYGKHWHVFVGRGQFSLFCSHKPNTSLQFKQFSTYYLMWMTDEL